VRHKKKAVTNRKAETGEPPKALLFELENLSVDGHRLAYEALASALKGKGIDLSPAAFSHYCVGRPPRAFVPRLLKLAGKERLSADKVRAEISASMNGAFKNANHRLNGSLKRLLTAAAGRHLLLGALSRLDGAVCEHLAGQLGLKSLGVKTFTQAEDASQLSGGNGWGALAGTMSVDPTLCVALVTAADSARAALGVRMRCVVIPSRFTEFQDFGGADRVVSSINDVHLEDLMALLEQKW